MIFSFFKVALKTLLSFIIPHQCCLPRFHEDIVSYFEVKLYCQKTQFFMIPRNHGGLGFSALKYHPKTSLTFPLQLLVRHNKAQNLSNKLL